MNECADWCVLALGVWCCIVWHTWL